MTTKYPGLRKKSRAILMLAFTIGLTLTGKTQSQLFTELKDNHALDAELYFYASTLRMINLKRNSDFDELVKDIKRMKFFKIKDFNRNEIRDIARRFREEEGFEELMTVEGKQTMYILGKSEDEFVSLVSSEGDLIAVSLEGAVGIHKIPELINSLNSDSFLNVFEIGQGERKEYTQDQKNP